MLLVALTSGRRMLGVAFVADDWCASHFLGSPFRLRVRLTADNARRGDIVVFMHVPKTGGTAIGSAVARHCVAHSIGFATTMGTLHRPNESWPFGFSSWHAPCWPLGDGRVDLAVVPPGPLPEHVSLHYFTMMRKPLDRVLSAIRFEWTTRGHFETVEEVAYLARVNVSVGKARRLLQSAEGRALSALGTAELQWRAIKQYANRSRVFDYPCAMFASCAHQRNVNLSESLVALDHFDFVGLKERFDESMVMLARVYGLTLTSRERRLNPTNAAAAARVTFDDTVKRRIEAQLECERQLYAHAVAGFHQQVLCYDAVQLERDVSAYRRLPLAGNDLCQWRPGHNPPCLSFLH